MGRKYYGDGRPFMSRYDDNFYFSVETRNLDTAKSEIIRLKCEQFRTELRQVAEAWDFDEVGQELIVSMGYTETKA